MSTRTLWVIRENQTQSWCVSSKFGSFGNFKDAAIFVSEANALKAIKSLTQQSGQQISVNGKCYMYGDLSLVDTALAQEHGIGFLPCDPQYEAVECALITQDKSS